MSDIIWKALGIILSAVISFIIGRLQAKYSALKKEKEQKATEDRVRDETLAECLKYQLRRALKDDHDFYVQQGWCSIEDKAEVKKAYRLYHDTYLHGNGAGTMYYESIMKLPDEQV